MAGNSVQRAVRPVLQAVHLLLLLLRADLPKGRSHQAKGRCTESTLCTVLLQVYKVAGTVKIKINYLL